MIKYHVVSCNVSVSKFKASYMSMFITTPVPLLALTVILSLVPSTRTSPLVSTAIYITYTEHICLSCVYLNTCTKCTPTIYRKEYMKVVECTMNRKLFIVTKIKE